MELLHYDLHSRVGGGILKTFVWKERTPNASPIGYADTPVDLTGYDARLQVRQAYGYPIAIELGIGTGIVINVSAGSIGINISSEQLHLLGQGRHVYSLLLKSPSGEVIVFSEGLLYNNAGAGSWPL